MANRCPASSRSTRKCRSGSRSTRFSSSRYAASKVSGRGRCGSFRSNNASPGRRAMSLSEPQRQLRDRFLQAMLEATFPLQKGPDPEVILEALIEATDMLRERFEQELGELRREET